MSLERLAGHVSGRGPAWFAAVPPGSPPAADVSGAADPGPRTRREVLRQLVADLAALGESAGTGQPPGTRPPLLADRALADQLLVLGHELASVPQAAGDAGGGTPPDGPVPADAIAAETDRLVAAARARL